MDSLQYTIRSIPPKVDQSLRERARKTGRSLNETVIEALKQSTGVAAEDQALTHHDLDWFFGQRRLGKEFDAAQDWLESLPKDTDDR